MSVSPKSCKFFLRMLLLFLLRLATSTGQVSQIPHSNVGPSGSTFKTASTWPNYQLAAFVDLNADRKMDVILLDPTGTQLFASVSPTSRSSLVFGGDLKQADGLPPPTPLLAPSLPNPIRSIVPADFNGDSVADLLILTSSSVFGPFEAFVAYGDKGTGRGLFVFDKTDPIATFASQPLICDLNADSVADIYGEVNSTSRLVILGGSRFSFHPLAYTGPQWSKFGYSAFGDVNGDTVPDILVLVEHSGESKLQLIYRDFRNLSIPFWLSRTVLIDLPRSLIGAPNLVLGLFVLADFDADGNIDLLLPACTSLDCRGSSLLFMYSFLMNAWSTVDVQWTPGGVSSDLGLSLTPTPSMGGSGLSLSSIVGPSVGDVNLDGRPDILVGLAYQSGSEIGSLPAVLVNDGPDSSNGLLKLRAFLLPGSNLPASDKQLKQITFFYNSEVGALDVFVTSWNPDSSQPTVVLLLQQMTNDYYFIKVNILNGLCANADLCADSRLPYGLPVPGQLSSFSTESSSGSEMSSIGLITTQSCCSALQLPTILFGLGPFANYVEQLTVTIPPGSMKARRLSIRALVPNSEVFVNPYPLDDPSRWTAKLFLQPLYNMKVIYIAITLIAVCIVLIIIISILLCLELREDRMEKLKEAQRFHFDAM